MNKNPCKGCNRRHAECHPTCEDYKAFEKRRDSCREQKLKEIAATPDFSPEKKKWIYKKMKEANGK